MALNLKKALSAYDRADTTKVDCGGGWFWEVKSFKSAAKVYAKELARIRALGGTKKKAAKTVSAGISGTEMPDGTEQYILGTLAADAAFFVENLSVGWEGLEDDNGNNVAYSPEIAEKLFLEHGQPGEQLLDDLLKITIDQKNFIRDFEEGDSKEAPVVSEVAATAEEDAKN